MLRQTCAIKLATGQCYMDVVHEPCTTWDHVLFVLDGWNWPSCAIALTSATSIQSTCYICCLRACALYICCIAARATYICCTSARATCTRCLDWPVRSHWPTHPLQEVWLTGEQIRSRLSTSPNLTQAVLSARVKAARKQKQQKNSSSSSSSPSSTTNPMLLPPPTQTTGLFVLDMTSREYLTSHNLQPLGEVQRRNLALWVVTEFAISSQPAQRGSHI